MNAFLDGNCHTYQLHDNDTSKEQKQWPFSVPSLLSPWWSAKPRCTKRGIGNQRQFQDWIDIQQKREFLSMGELYINSIPPKISKINYPKIQFPQKSKNPGYVVWRFPKLPMEVLVELKRVKLWSWGSASQWENLQGLMQALMKQWGVRYCWWKQSCTSW